MKRRGSAVVCAIGVGLLVVSAICLPWINSRLADGQRLFTLDKRERLRDRLGVAASKDPKNNSQLNGRFTGLSALSAAPIKFYGKVIDENGEPLSGVEAVAGTGSKTGFMQEETRNYTTISDQYGLFSFSGMRGDALIIDLKKWGYNFDTSRRTFHYSAIDPDRKRFTPDASQPVVFRMWKSLGSEPMVHYYGKFIETPADGTPVNIDLFKGRRVSNDGDLVVSTKWGLRDGPNDMSFDWRVRIEAVDGGLLEGGPDVCFVAPTDGYQPSIEYFFANDKEGRFEKTFYVATHAGERYSRVQMGVDRQEGDLETRISLRVWLNPNHSRNLEYDPSKRIESN